MVEQLIHLGQNIGIGMFFYATALFIISIITGRNDIADVAWGLAYCFIIVITLISGARLHAVAILVFSLITFWGIRLSFHIYLRNKNKKEDFRYKKWRDEWGSSFYWRSYLQVYILQGVFAIVISAPILLAASYKDSSYHWLSIVGVVVWLVGFYFQSIGDLQLKQFKNQSKDREAVINSGLWKYTRHPNYFGEVVMWWGIFIIVLPLEYGWCAVISPLVITYLIRYVSGVPMLEKRYTNNAKYQEYKKQVPALFPKFW